MTARHVKLSHSRPKSDGFNATPVSLIYQFLQIRKIRTDLPHDRVSSHFNVWTTLKRNARDRNAANMSSICNSIRNASCRKQFRHIWSCAMLTRKRCYRTTKWPWPALTDIWCWLSGTAPTSQLRRSNSRVPALAPPTWTMLNSTFSPNLGTIFGSTSLW